MTGQSHEPEQNATDQDQDPFLAFTGDQVSAARLRTNLANIAENHPGTGVAAIVSEVLAGRRPLRDLADNPEFSDVVEAGVHDYRTYLASLSPHERAEMVATAKESISPAE